MAEELFVKLSDINGLLPNCCEICRDQIEDLRAFRLDGDRIENIRKLLERVHGDALNLISWANKPITATRRKPPDQSPMRSLLDRASAVVENSFGLPPGRLLVRSREQAVALPRHVAMFVMHSILDVSYPEIGKYFGMHHTTVMHGVGKIAELVKTDAKLEKRITDIDLALARRKS